MKRKPIERHTSAKPQEGREFFAASVAPSTINDEQRTVDVIWFTGIDVPRMTWSGKYIRRFDPKGVDLSLLNSAAPVFDNHDTWSGTESQKGVVDKAWVDGKDYKATLRFKRSTPQTGPRPDLDGLWQDIKDKVVTKFSMGVEIVAEHEIKVEGQDTIRFADKWRPFEISCAPLPADFGTDTLSAREHHDAEECGCDCASCKDGDCSECTNENCTDENCTGCPMQSEDHAAQHRIRETETLRLR